MKPKVVALVLAMIVCACVLVGLFASPIRANSPSPEEQLKITNVHCSVGSDGWFAVTVNNTGVASVTITQFLVNGVKQSSVMPLLPVVLEPNGSLVFNASLSVESEGKYQIEVLTAQESFSTFEQTSTTA
jgi:hypothetical protein